MRTVNQFTDLDQMRDLLVTSLAGVPVRLRDVATVTQGFKEREAVIRFKGREAVELAIYKEGDANTVAAADAVRTMLQRLERTGAGGGTGTPGGQSAAKAPGKPGAYLIDGVAVQTIEDQSTFIRNALTEVKREAVLGGILSILIIFFFLRDGWSTFVIGLSLPVSIVATFFFMDRLGLSHTVMSLAGLALATGMVVDDSIVVLESIAKARERGLGVLEAAVVGTREVSMAVVASTLTTVAVFFPLVFVEGVAGQLFKDQALTVSIALMISLVVSLTLIPMLSSIKAKAPLAFPPEPAHPDWQPTHPVGRVAAVAGRAGKRGVGLGVYAASFAVVTGGRAFAQTFGAALAWLGRKLLAPYELASAWYRRMLPRALQRPWLILGSAAAAFAISLAVATTLGTDLIPQLAQDRFEMTAKLPPGTQLRETDALVRAVQQAHDGDDDIEALYGVSGTGTRLDANPTESGDNVAKLSVVLGEHYSKDTEAAVTERMRTTMASYPDISVKFGRPQLFSFSTPMEIELRGHDIEALQRAGRKLAQMMQASPHFADVKSSVEQGYPEVQIRFDQERGEVATRYSFRDRKIDVLVRGQESNRASVADIRRTIVNPQSERPVTLDAVADVVETIGPSEIHRANQTRVALVSSNLRGVDLGTAVREVEQMVRENPLGADVRLAFGGQSEELDSSIRSLLFAFGLAIFLVYLVMASQFESLLHPCVIIFSVPLAMVGAVMALWLSGSAVSVVVVIGLILLVGIVVKNAIVLIDKVNQLREEGMPKREAISEGALSRLRPIVMTTLCTLFGFAPLAFMGGDGAEVRAPMAITVIGGLAVSTLLTLVVIPIMYDLLDRKPDAAYRARGDAARQARAAEQGA